MKFVSILLFFTLSAHVYGQERTNIVFFLADDLTRWDIGCYGSPNSRTPTLDSLATGGMRFTKCYQAAPMCSPTRHNLYTGIYPTRTGAYPNHTYASPGTKSIVHYLKPLGYRIALSGKRHIGPAEVFPFEYLGDQRNPDFGKVDTFLQDVSSRDEPFCLFLCSNEPHYPWNRGDASRFDRNHIILPPHYVDNVETREAYCHYLAEINYLDGQVREALELLDKHKFRENTVFIFASEQGNAFPFAKWTCYNAGLGSALIVRWPGTVKPGSVSDALVEYADICPTLIDIAGGAPVRGLDGSSLVPLLKGEKTTHKKYTYGIMTTRGIHSGSEYYPIRSVSNGTYRYILNLAPEMEFSNVARMPGWKDAAKTDPAAAALIKKHKYRPPVELYNDLEDPYNRHNLAGQKTYRRIEEELAAQLKKWMEYAGDEGLLTELRAFEHMMNHRNGDSLIVLTDFHPPGSAGNLDVPIRGFYTFYISGEGSIFVDEQFIVKGSPADDEREAARYGIIALEQGRHQLDLKEYHEDTRLQWSGPGFQRTGINLDRPNVVIIVADDLGYADVSFNGGDIATPHIDRIANEGVNLRRFYACPVCSPTRAGLMTGRWPLRFGCMRAVLPPWRDRGMPPEEHTIAELLAEEGYQERACMGKWHLGHYRKAFLPTHQGFTHFYGHYNGAIDYFTHKREGEPDWHRNEETSHDEGYTTELLAEEAVSFIREAAGQKEPFLLYLPFNAPHGPYQALKQDIEKFTGIENEDRRIYAAMVHAMDRAVGKILNEMDACGITENTLVVFFSDNGGVRAGDNAPLRGGKFQVLEGGVRVCAAARWPAGGISGGRNIDEGPIGYIDIYPTLCAILEAEPDTVSRPPDGMNVIDVMRGRQEAPERDWFSYIHQSGDTARYAVIREPWKLVLHTTDILTADAFDRARKELYNLELDLQEQNNLAAQKPGMVEELFDALVGFHQLQRNPVPQFQVGREGFVAPVDWLITRE